MGMMKAQYNMMSDKYQEAMNRAIMNIFTVEVRSSSQAVGNILYSLGLSGVKAAELPMEVLEALYYGLETYGPELKSQEFSNSVYGLGLMKADVDLLPDNVLNALIMSFRRVVMIMNDQEVCSTLHGFAKMNCEWDSLQSDLKTCIMLCVGLPDEQVKNRASRSLCLACSIYSLGLLGAEWSQLPSQIRYRLASFAIKEGTSMKDQTLSNIIYGFGLMQAQWATLEKELRDVILLTLEQPDSFARDISQHISNTLWALAKMDASWADIPFHRLEEAFIRCEDSFNAQEICNSIYGFAILDASWNELSLSTKKTIVIAMRRNAAFLDHQEVANVMYSLSLMTFDFDPPPEGGSGSFYVQNEEERATSNTLLWELHDIILKQYCLVKPPDYSKENYDQFAMYFEMMSVVPQGVERMKLLFGEDNQGTPESDGISACYSGPAGTIPSRLHANTVESMIKFLQKKAKVDKTGRKFTLFNEYSGLKGVFPVDAAVYDGDKLLAFVEIDGESHYKQFNQKLRRKDKLKEFLYRFHYPSIPLYRIRSDQVDIVGTQKAGESLGMWIYSLPSPETHISNNDNDSDNDIDYEGSVTRKPKAKPKAKAKAKVKGKLKAKAEPPIKVKAKTKAKGRPRKILIEGSNENNDLTPVPPTPRKRSGKVSENEEE